jgi:hypothetical protein
VRHSFLSISLDLEKPWAALTPQLACPTFPTLVGPKLQPTLSTSPLARTICTRTHSRRRSTQTCIASVAWRHHAATQRKLPVEFDPILGLDLHHYPDPSHPKIKERIAELRGLPGSDHVFLGVGSDEVIDLLMRVCVTPGREKIYHTTHVWHVCSMHASQRHQHHQGKP